MNSNLTSVVYLMICGALGYLFGGLADAGWAVVIGAASPYALSGAVALCGAFVGAEPALINGRRAARRAR